MKALNQFRRFDFPAFSSGKDFCVTGLVPWTDYNTKAQLGWKAETTIVRDETPYTVKDGQVVSNLYQLLTFKCARKPDIALGDIVTPVGDVVCTVYGQYNNMLSVKCETVRVVDQKGKD